MAIRFPFFNNKKENNTTELKRDNMPEHIAIIMDGNGRWAKNKGLPRIAGHKEGMTVVRNIVRAAVKYRSEERRIGKECRARWARGTYRQKGGASGGQAGAGVSVEQK